MADYRARMVDEHLVRRGIQDRRVLDVMRSIERHRFVPEARSHMAYGDFPVAIGKGQTLSQPYIVAVMTEALELDGGETVLEIGTGSGYQTAVLAALAHTVYTVEIKPELARSARARLEAMGYENLCFKVGDGKVGWADDAPFDAILCAAAPKVVPDELPGAARALRASRDPHRRGRRAAARASYPGRCTWLGFPRPEPRRRPLRPRSL